MRPNIRHWPEPVYTMQSRVYFDDTDAGGIVYHANYLRYMERARTDWLRSLGVSHTELARGERIVLVVRDAQLEFLKPARLDDELLIDVRLLALRRASIQLAQTVRSSAGPELLATGTVRIAALSSADNKVAALPEWLMERIER